MKDKNIDLEKIDTCEVEKSGDKEMQTELFKSNKTLTNIAENVPGVIYTYQQFQDGRSCFPYAPEQFYDIME